MKNRAAIQDLFENATANYPRIKALAEAGVSTWQWASDQCFSMEPFYFEQHRFAKGKILKNPPENKENKVHYGLSEDGAVVIEQAYTGLPERFYETFYLHSHQSTDRYYYGYDVEKKILAVSRFIFNNEQLSSIVTWSHEGWKEEVFEYTDGKVMTTTLRYAKGDSEPTTRTKHFGYDEFGVLASISEGDFYSYKKPNKEPTLAQLATLATGRLTQLVTNALRKEAPSDPLYCINLSYSAEHVLSPEIGYGLEAEREAWTAAHGAAAKDYLWNVAEYSNVQELALDGETAALFDLLNQEALTKGKRAVLMKVITDCAVALSAIISRLGLAITEDFLVVATDLEGCDLKKNFKTIYPGRKWKG